MCASVKDAFLRLFFSDQNLNQEELPKLLSEHVSVTYNDYCYGNDRERTIQTLQKIQTIWEKQNHSLKREDQERGALFYFYQHSLKTGALQVELEISDHVITNILIKDRPLTPITTSSRTSSFGLKQRRKSIPSLILSEESKAARSTAPVSPSKNKTFRMLEGQQRSLPKKSRSFQNAEDLLALALMNQL